jgi:Papain family cysteine protease
MMENIKMDVNLKETLRNIADTDGYVMLKSEAAAILARLVELEVAVNSPGIKFTRAEIQSGSSRVVWAEGLILQMPPDHEGRNSWLLNYGISKQADEVRDRFKVRVMAKPENTATAEGLDDTYKAALLVSGTRSLVHQEYPTTESITQQEFIDGYCKRSNVTWEKLSQTRVALPCRCDDPTCDGWAMVFNDPVSVKDHLSTNAPPLNQPQGVIKMKARYNWQPDLPDHRDHMFEIPFSRVIPLSIDLSSKFPPPFDQGDLGSCTGNALAGQMAFLHPSNTFSRLFIYRGERAIEHTVSSDSGAQIRDGVKFLASSGCCLESEWPYDVARFKALPPKKCFTDAKPFAIKEYLRLNTLDDMLHCLASGFPFTFGFTVYESFESDFVASTGVLNMPLSHEKVVGGHAVEAVGYDLNTKRFKVRNSWGTAWGQGGHFTIPFDYLANRNLSDDFWTIRK